MNGESNEMKQLAPAAPQAVPSPIYYEHYTENATEPASQGFNLRDTLVVVFKHKYKILSVFLLAIICAPVIYKLIPVSYEATSVLMVRYGREYATPNVSEGQNPLKIGLPEILNSEVAILSSKDLKETVISKIGVDKISPQGNAVSAGLVDPTQAVILAMEKSLLIESSKSSNLITVSYHSKDPRMAAEVVNTLVNNYQEKRLEILGDPKPTLFLENKVASLHNRLKDSEQKLESFKQTNRVYAFEDQRTTLLHNRESLDEGISAGQTQMKELDEKLKVLKNESNSISKAPTGSPGMDAKDGAEGQLLTLKRKEQELLSKYKDTSPLVASVRQEMKAIENFMAQRKKSGEVPTNGVALELQKEIITTKAELASLEARVTLQKQQLESLDKDIQTLDLQENYVRDMRRELASSEAMYDAYSKKLDEARVSDDMDRQKMTSINIIEKASVPIRPTSPSKPLSFFVLAAAAGGLGGGIAFAILLESLGQGLISPQKAEKRLNLPVLLVIPKDAELIERDLNLTYSPTALLSHDSGNLPVMPHQS